jgi:hypothetical protein
MRNAISLQNCKRAVGLSIVQQQADQTMAVSPVQTYVLDRSCTSPAHLLGSWLHACSCVRRARNSYQRRDPAAVRHRRDTQALLYRANGVHRIDSHQRFSCPPRSRQNDEGKKLRDLSHSGTSDRRLRRRAVVVSDGTDKVGAERTDEPLSL